MSQELVTFRNGRIFDGAQFHDDHAILFAKGRQAGFGRTDEMPDQGKVIDLGGDILSPGYADLQVNGGDGVMLGDHPSVAVVARIAAAHRALGVTRILPTLITDTPANTQTAIQAVAEACAQGVPGVAGLHLEGPHLSIARKGAHDAALIRPMEPEDLASLIEAAEALPCLKVTLAPENVALDQVAQLAEAGVLVSLGHTDASYDTCRRYFEAGARCTTHLFNAMSQLGNREPGLVGAALDCASASAGIIADGIHVHPKTIRAAWAAKVKPGAIFLVSDAMAAAGTDVTEFELNGRRIWRQEGRLTLEDGTLAGADLDLTTAIRVLVDQVGIALEQALAAATSVPAALIAQPAPDPTLPGTDLSGLIRISRDLSTVTPLGPCQPR